VTLHPGRHAPRQRIGAKPKRLLLALPQEMAERTTAAALAAGVSVSEWVRQAVLERLERKGSQARYSSRPSLPKS
jgi:predicted HicB family RNase H-like nuclease